MGNHDTAKSVIIAFAFLCLVAWNAVLQTQNKSNLKEVERRVKAHEGNFKQMESKFEGYDNNFEHMEAKQETHDSQLEHLKGELANHDSTFKEHRILIKSVDEAASRRVKRSINLQTTGGAIYIRWGRQECPNDAELVYTGVTGGQASGHTGGGSEYLCLSDEPKYANHGSSYTNAAYIYGVELELSLMNKVLLETSNARLSPLDNSDVQCAVCRSRSKTSMVMIPGTNECSSGWNMEYWGYLMTGRWDQKAQHSYACLDHAPNAGTDGGTTTDAGGASMYHVLGECGSLPCMPYVHHFELTCVVCTK